MTNRDAYRTLPALRTSLKWFKRECVRNATATAERVSAGARPMLANAVWGKVTKIRATAPHEFRADYLSMRARTMVLAELFDAVRARGGSIRRL